MHRRTRRRQVRCGRECERIERGHNAGHSGCGGRTYYDRKLAEGKTHKEALRCLKRRISDALYARLCADAKDGQILIDGKVQASIEGAAGTEPAGELTLKGFHRPVLAHNVKTLRV